MNQEFKQILEAVREGRSADLYRTIEGKEYHRKFIPKDRLILLGGGNVSQDVARMAAFLEFEIIVVDDRPAFANSALFPEASQILCEKFDKAIEQIGIRSTDYVCVMTRGHRHDALCVRTLFGGVMPYYVGMIGSKRRADDFRTVLREEGYPEERIAALHAPIGISIHALTTPEIGVSVCAELIAERRREGKGAHASYLAQTNTDIDTIEFLAQSEEPRAMILVLDSEGSTPAKPGAVMGVDRIGRTMGTIGGGCSEAEAVVKARRLIGTGGTGIVEIDMTNEVAEEIGMVCGGRMWAYLEELKETYDEH